ncbi:MAG: sterol desaturase family protein [Bacteroidetes bacterium]|nr:sterol desaturase family protein [Bacteroidota bacterium]
MIWLYGIIIVLLAFAAMEGVAWFTHKYIMHGILWSWHKSHHRPHKGFFEKNDLFSVVFSIPAMALTMYGFYDYQNLWYLAYTGIGITLYGVAYFVFHDVIVHRRYKHHWRFNGYMRKIIRIHKIHHKHLEKEGAEAFGFLYGGKHYKKV